MRQLTFIMNVRKAIIKSILCNISEYAGHVSCRAPLSRRIIMKRSLLDKWCGQPWLHATCFLGILMFNVMLINWNVWDVPQKKWDVLPLSCHAMCLKNLFILMVFNT